MIHIALHLVVPLLVAGTVYRRRWRSTFAVLLATMAVDLDHLLANPIYDPERCSIGFHPLHTVPAIALYFALLAVPLALRLRSGDHQLEGAPRWAHLTGLGLLIHMALDWGDCLL